MPFRLALTLGVVAVAILRAHPAGAQAVQGVVVDDQNQSRVSTATVRVVLGGTVGQGTETDTRGHFFLHLPRDGRYRLEVSRLGYRTTLSQAFVVANGDTVSVEFRVSPDAVVMDPITVTAHSSRGRNLFERHREDWGKGVYLTPQQIDAMHLREPADFLRKGMDHVNVTWNWGRRPSGGMGPIPVVRSQLGTGCVLYMVNHIFVGAGAWRGWELGGLLPEDIAAVEFFRSVSEVPPKLRRFTHDRMKLNCGLMVIWTKSAW